MKANSSTAPAPAPAAPTAERTFGTDEQAALVTKQVKAFVKHTNNQAVLNELQTVLTSGRNEIGWKALGRIFLEELKLGA